MYVQGDHKNLLGFGGTYGGDITLPHIGFYGLGNEYENFPQSEMPHIVANPGENFIVNLIFFVSETL